MEKRLFCEKLGDVLNTEFCGVICVSPEFHIHGLTQEVAPSVTTEPLAVFLKSCRLQESQECIMLTVKLSGSGGGILAAMTSVPLKKKPCE